MDAIDIQRGACGLRLTAFLQSCMVWRDEAFAGGTAISETSLDLCGRSTRGGAALALRSRSIAAYNRCLSYSWCSAVPVLDTDSTRSVRESCSARENPKVPLGTCRRPPRTWALEAAKNRCPLQTKTCGWTLRPRWRRFTEPVLGNRKYLLAVAPCSCSRLLSVWTLGRSRSCEIQDDLTA